MRQCGIIEVDSFGDAFVAANRPDFGEEYLRKEIYKLDSHLRYDPRAPSGSFKTFHSRGEYRQLHSGESSVFQEKFGLHYGFSCLVKISEGVNRIYWFASDSADIYDRSLEAGGLVRKLINCFGDNSQEVVNHFRDFKFGVAEIKSDYFVGTDSRAVCPREELNRFLSVLCGAWARA